MKTLILGLGNPLLTDDGVGWHVIGALREREAPDPDVEIEECCRGGLALMERMIGYDRVLVVDAIKTRAGALPGTIHRLAPDDLPTQHSASAHDASLSAALALGRAAGAHLPTNDEVLLIGIEAAETEVFDERCTPSVAAAIPRAVEVLKDELALERRPAWP